MPHSRRFGGPNGLLDHFMSAGQEGSRHGKTKRLRGLQIHDEFDLEIHDEFDLARLLDRQVARIRAFKDFCSIDCEPSEPKRRYIGKEPLPWLICHCRFRLAVR